MLAPMHICFSSDDASLSGQSVVARLQQQFQVSCVRARGWQGRDVGPAQEGGHQNMGGKNNCTYVLNIDECLS